MNIGVLVAIMMCTRRNNESFSYSVPSYKSSVISCVIMLMINTFLIYLVINNLFVFKNELLNNILLYVLAIDALVSFIALPYFIIKMIIE